MLLQSMGGLRFIEQQCEGAQMCVSCGYCGIIVCGFSLEIGNALVMAGANVNAKLESGAGSLLPRHANATPMQLAEQGGHHDTSAYLKSVGAIPTTSPVSAPSGGSGAGTTTNSVVNGTPAVADNSPTKMQTLQQKLVTLKSAPQTPSSLSEMRRRAAHGHLRVKVRL
jgi:hypothetical protein